MCTKNDGTTTKEIIDEAVGRGLPRRIEWLVRRTYLQLGLEVGDKVEMHLRAASHNDGAPILWYEGQVRGGDGLEAFRTGGYGSTMNEAVQEAKAKLEEYGCT